jgi:hypothetical protein
VQSDRQTDGGTNGQADVQLAGWTHSQTDGRTNRHRGRWVACRMVVRQKTGCPCQWAAEWMDDQGAHTVRQTDGRMDV